MSTTPTRREQRAVRRYRRLQALKWCAALIVLITLSIVAGDSVGPVLFRAAAWSPDWQVAACDIGQGDAVAIHDRTDDVDRYGLVDVGPDAKLLTACLDRLGIARLDLLVLTHYDLDHVGGIDAVLGRASVVLMGPPDDAGDARLVDALTRAGAEVRQARRGDTGQLGSLCWSVLWPETGTTLRGNDASVTLQVDGSLHSLFLGDLGEDSQRLVMAAGELPHEDIVKVAHHGSADQSSDLYHAVAAQVGLISVGANNRYGHPTDRLLSVLRETHTSVFRTDRSGLVVVSPVRGGIEVWSEGQARVEKKK